MEQAIATALARLFGWDVLSLAGGIYFLMVGLKIMLGEETKDGPLINRLLFVAPFLFCIGLAFLPGMFEDVTAAGAKLRMGLWTGGLSMFYHLIIKFIFGDKARAKIQGKVSSLIEKGK